MARITFILVFVFLCKFVLFQALECGLHSSSNEEEFQNAVKKCIPKQRSLGLEESEEVDSAQRKRKEKRGTNDSDEKVVNTTNNGDCALQCIFSTLNMVNSQGYPDRARVSETLLKYANGREVRDFLQESTDDCFEIIDHGVKLDTCEFSNRLTKCLVDRGSANCADWEIANLPIKS